MNEYLKQIKTLIANNPNMFDDLKEKHRDDFLRWLDDNTHVVRAFGRYAIQLKEQGHREYYSAYAIRERLRWDSMLSEVGTEYKLSNNMTPFLARLMMKMDRRLAGIFRTKNMQNDDFVQDDFLK